MDGKAVMVSIDDASKLRGVADEYSREGNYELALEKYNECLRMYEAIYGHNHAAVAICLIDIATVYGSQENHEQALAKHYESLTIFEAIYGHIHADVAMCLNNIALVYYLQDEYDLALEKYQESLLINEAVHGHDHPDVADSLLNVSLALSAISSRHDEALAKCTEALQIYLRQCNHDETNPDVKRVRTIMGNFKASSGYNYDFELF
jgi:tetratricopeptide (TPR) repeat protein